MRAPGALMGAGGGGRGEVAQARRAAVEPLRLTDEAGRGAWRGWGSVPAGEALEASVVPAGLGRGGEGAELRGTGRQGCSLPPGMGDVAPHLWMPVALRLFELLQIYAPMRRTSESHPMNDGDHALSSISLVHVSYWISAPVS